MSKQFCTDTCSCGHIFFFLFASSCGIDLKARNVMNAAFPAKPGRLDLGSNVCFFGRAVNELYFSFHADSGQY